MRSPSTSGPGTTNGMPASRSLRLARTSRWAIVASGTTKALAISTVDRPATARKRQRHLGFDGEGRVAAGEQQLELLVAERLAGEVLVRVGAAGRLLRPGQLGRQHLGLLAEAGLAPQPVEGLAPGRRGDPRPWTIRHAPGRPGGQGDRDGLLHGVLGQPEVARVAHQHAHDLAPLVADEAFEGLVRELRCRRPPGAHGIGKSSSGRTSIEP